MDGGLPLLNGTDSREHPYTCGLREKSITVYKSLTISNWFARVYISCAIVFTRIPPGRTGITPTPGVYSTPTSDEGVETGSQLRITLKNVSFVRHGVTCYGGFCYFEVVNSSFVQGGLTCNGSCSVNISNSNFSNCRTALDLKESNVVNLEVTNSTFYNNVIAINVTNKGPKIIAIAHSKFIRNGPQPLIKIDNIYTETHVKIHDCTFQDDYWSPIDEHLIDIQCGSLSGNNITFYRNKFTAIAGPGIFLSGCFNSTFEDLSMINMTSFAVSIDTHAGTHACSRAITVQMNNCAIHGTSGRRRSYAAIHVEAHHITMSMNYLKLQSNKRFLFSFSAKKGSLTISNSDFANNSVEDEDYLLSISKKYNDWGLNNPLTIMKEEQNRIAGDVVVNFHNIRFSYNKVLRSMIRLFHTSTTLSNVTFGNNTVEGLGGDIHISENNSVSLQNSRFERSSRHYYASAFVYSDVNSNSSVNITNCGFKSHVESERSTIFYLKSGIHIHIDKQSNITCPLGYFLQNTVTVSLSGDITDDTYKPTCQKCSVGLYNLQQLYAIPDTPLNEQCIPCPYGGNCTHGIVAKPNFWGYVVPKEHRPTVAFKICPLEYCDPNPRSYNSCFGHRNGFLCGQCREGYTEAMFSSECHETEDCHNNWFWFFSFVYIACFSFLLITRPCLFEVLWETIVWFRPRSGGHQSSQYSPASDGQHCNGKHFDHAFVKTIFYFYQTVELLLISTSPEGLMNKVKFVRPLVSLFNFEIWNEKFGCPFPGLTAVTKELFSSMTVFGTIACIATICFSHKAMGCIGCLNHPRINLYLAATVETLLLGYEKLTDVSLSLMNCIPVDSEWRLFLDGNIFCWQWWQHALLSFIAVFVVPFIFVLFWGSKKLNEHRVSTKELAMACILPLPFLCYWAVRYCIKAEASQGHREEGEEIKEVLHEPFRPPGEDDGGTLYWESVLIGRRLVLLCLHSFIADPMLRLLCLDFACMAVLLHHLHKRPYRDPKANACESFSLVALVIIATFSLAEASLVSEGTEVGSLTEHVFGVLQWIELVLLCVVPACLFVLASLAVVSQLFRLFFHVIRFIKRQLKWPERRWDAPAGIQRPLLYSLCM